VVVVVVVEREGFVAIVVELNFCAKWVRSEKKNG
jgi:hypothetical protein